MALLEGPEEDPAGTIIQGAPPRLLTPRHLRLAAAGAAVDD
eukprot:CAMPEP_0171671494 /NCGR_PEP_ID=MMETSP0990-20121206/51322_1 /TAXON_ID=483369 /ORGANISM="non described non described, Strain CCMP2098" /LENGTH=40 /DNA_ID= /DNA_START= /DNA_END= /DNA_ORIENTATION=